MIDLFSLMQNAQGGAAFDNMARAYGVSAEQAQRAMAALMPAFATGLNRTAATPDGMQALFQAMMQPAYLQMFEDPRLAFSPQAMMAGNNALGMMFGSKDISRAVADQAAQFAGIGPAILKQMLPVIAAMLMGGLFKGTASQAQAQGGPLADIFGQILGGMMGGGQPQAQAPNPMGPLGDLLGGMMGGGQARQGQAQNPMGPWGDLLGGMMGGGPAGREGGQPGQSPFGPLGDIFGQILTGGLQPGSRPASPGPGAPAFPDLSDLSNQLNRMGETNRQMMGDMFEAGQQAQRDQIDAMQQIFDAFMGGGPRRA
jgi:hypothetical protein